MKVLDHGYVELVETWGSDERIIEAARMSTGKGFLGWGPQTVDVQGEGRHTVDCSSHKAAVRQGSCDCDPTPGDERLLRYLYEHRHATPFEMAGMVVEVQAPIFVFREWHRHRTQCLRGSTEITCVSPRGVAYKRTIKEIHDLKHGGVVDQMPERTRNGYSNTGTPVFRKARRKNATRTRLLPNCQGRMLRVLDEGSELYETAPMADVWEAGVKDVFEVKTRAGHVVGASAKHRFLTREGWKRVDDLRPGDRLAANGLVAAMERPIPPALRAGIGVWTTMMRSRLIEDEDQCYVCGVTFKADDLQLDHVVPVVLDLKLALDEDNLRPVCDRCHREKTNEEQVHRQHKMRLGLRWVELTDRPSRIGEEMTYDIEVAGPHHNFVADGLVVHNSYNELSARYTPIPDVNYIPTVERIMMPAGKQGGGSKTVAPRVAEAFLMDLKVVYAEAEDAYQEALDAGIPKELARLVVPVGRYSRMRASANLRNWLAFLTLRSDKNPDAQWEIRQFANAVGSLIKDAFPRTWELFDGKGI